MNGNEIGEKIERVAKALALKPTLGRGCGVSVARIADGLACEIKEGPWELKTDLPEQAGGKGQAPPPGVLGRAALSSCLATGYRMWAAKLGVAIRSIEVEVRAEWDDCGLFGVTDVSPGYLDVHYLVRIDADAPREEVERVIELGDRHSPYLDVFSRAQACNRTVEIVSGGEGEQ